MLLHLSSWLWEDEWEGGWIAKYLTIATTSHKVNTKPDNRLSPNTLLLQIILTIRVRQNFAYTPLHH